MDENALIVCKNIYKSFGATQALSDVSIEVFRGQVCGLIGENGSGKSTLTSIIAGVQPANSGEMYFCGEKYLPNTMIEAQNKGVSMIVQEMGTISDLTVAENIFLGKEQLFSSHGFLNIKKMDKEAAKILTSIGASDISPGANVSTLNFEDRKIVEIARAMYNQPELLIIDETTTALATKGREIIYKIIRQLCDENKAVIFISHDLDELMEVCNTVTVLRDGIFITSLSKDEMNINAMREYMIGRELKGDYYRPDFESSGGEKVVLALSHTTYNEVEDLSLELHEGEILGIGGLADSGMHEIGRLAFGVDKPITGYVEHHGEKKITSIVKACEAGMGYVSKNRDQEAIILRASILDNTVIPAYSLLEKFGIILPKSEKIYTEEQIKKLSIKCRKSSQLVSELSGGNKQKVVFAKWIGKDVDILVLDCPTRGVDIGVKAAMYQLMYDLKKRGKSILMISEELPELIGMSDRILIMKNGKISAEFKRSKDLQEKQIIHHMI